MELSEDEIMPCASPLGYPAKKMSIRENMMRKAIKANTRLNFEELFFDGAFDMAKLIINGKLDTFLVQPKNALIGVITSKSSVSAIGDLIYAYIILFIYGFSILRFMLFTFLIIIGGIVLTEVSVITGSLCFWLTRGDLLVDNVNHIMVTTATYPDTIFKNAVRLLLYTIIPVGMTAYLPCNIILAADNLILFDVRGNSKTKT